MADFKESRKREMGKYSLSAFLFSAFYPEKHQFSWVPEVL
jgi:hypothetical protein